MSIVTFIVTPDDKCIIIFGSKYRKSKTSDNILILNLNTWKLRKSYIKCPFEGPRRVQLMSTGFYGKNKLIIPGYIRLIIYTNDINGYKNIPNDLIESIINWCSSNKVHIFQIGSIF